MKLTVIAAVVAGTAAAPTEKIVAVVPAESISEDKGPIPALNWAPTPELPVDKSKNALESWLTGWKATEVKKHLDGTYEAMEPVPYPPVLESREKDETMMVVDDSNGGSEELGLGLAYPDPAFQLDPGCTVATGSVCTCRVININGSSCITNTGTNGVYPNNLHCTFTVTRGVTVYSQTFVTESGFDHLTVNGQEYSGSEPHGLSGPNGILLTTGSNISWYSDYSVTRNGFTICVVPAFDVVGSARNTECEVTYEPNTNIPCIQNLQYSSNEACTFRVTSTVQLNVSIFNTETYFDNLYVNGVAYSGHTGPQGVRVAAGSDIYWKSDGSVTYTGFKICVQQAFELLSSTPPATAQGPCNMTSGPSGDSCIYNANYNNNERCSYKVTMPEVTLNSVFFSTEDSFDTLTIGTTRYTGTNGPKDLAVPQNTPIVWRSDYSVTRGGWEICATLESPCTATCNADGSVNLPPTQFAELLVGYGQPGNYKGPAPQMHNSCCGSSGGFCGFGQFHDNQCRNALSVLVNELGYTGPALTCKFYSCTSPTGHEFPIFSRLAYASASACHQNAPTLADLVCHPPLRTTPRADTGFLCTNTDECQSTANIPGAGPKEGVSLSTCRSTCGASAGRYSCISGTCTLSTSGTSLYACQQQCS